MAILHVKVFIESKWRSELMKEDFIISRHNQNEYLKITNITKQEIENFYKASVVKDHFSEELKNIIHE